MHLHKERGVQNGDCLTGIDEIPIRNDQETRTTDMPSDTDKPSTTDRMQVTQTVLVFLQK